MGCEMLAGCNNGVNAEKEPVKSGPVGERCLLLSFVKGGKLKVLPVPGFPRHPALEERSQLWLKLTNPEYLCM
jgi:hypothetical protein